DVRAAAEQGFADQVAQGFCGTGTGGPWVAGFGDAHIGDGRTVMTEGDAEMVVVVFQPAHHRPAVPGFQVDLAPVGACKLDEFDCHELSPACPAAADVRNVLGPGPAVSPGGCGSDGRRHPRSACRKPASP